VRAAASERAFAAREKSRASHRAAAGAAYVASRVGTPKLSSTRSSARKRALSLSKSDDDGENGSESFVSKSSGEKPSESFVRRKQKKLLVPKALRVLEDEKRAYKSRELSESLVWTTIKSFFNYCQPAPHAAARCCTPRTLRRRRPCARPR
jgi:hypothetical protein